MWWGLSSRLLKPDYLAEVLNSRDGVERAGHNLAGARALRFVRQPCLEQLGVGKHHAELIIEAMEDLGEVWRQFH